MSTPLHDLTARIEGLTALDGPAKALGKTVRGAFGPGALRDGLAGTWLGHALHPMLTDVVITSFAGATLLDLIGGKDSDTGARRLIGLGIAAYGPTAATGVTDWADSEAVDPAVRRVGVVHASGNAVALTLYALSLRARRGGRRGRGRLLSLAGMGVMGAGGYLGGHLAHARGVGVDQTAFDRGPDDWTPVIQASSLPERRPQQAFAGDTPVLLVRDNGRIHALHDRCSHRGCSLAAGELRGDAIVCRCHGSEYGLADGAVRRGPASTGQPVFAVREQEGRVEVRLPSPD